MNMYHLGAELWSQEDNNTPGIHLKSVFNDMRFKNLPVVLPLFAVKLSIGL
jgi:hypothetical protein